MRTVCGSGASTNLSIKSAIEEATRAAMVPLGRDQPKFGFLFASPDADLEAGIAMVRDITGAEIIGCTTAGEITEKGLTHGGLALLLVASDATIRVEVAEGLKEHPNRVTRSIVSELQNTKKKAAASDQRHLTTVLLTDGLAGTGEQLVNELYEARVQSGSQIVGGAAGDEGRFSATYVGADRARPDAAAAMHVFSSSAWAVGVDHGLRPTTKPMRVTRAEGNVVHEIDGEPAFVAYQRHAAGKGISLSRDNAQAYMIANEIGIHFFEKINRARAPLSVTADGALHCAGAIPRGSMVSILDGEPTRMIAAARAAAHQAHAQLNGAKAAGILLFDCVCRGMILKEVFNREVEAVRSIFPDVPIAGFLTYGEIARSSERLGGWHNTTAVVVAIAA
jgi:methyl-accepting chemotaxis protein